MCWLLFAGFHIRSVRRSVVLPTFGSAPITPPEYMTAVLQICCLTSLPDDHRITMFVKRACHWLGPSSDGEAQNGMAPPRTSEFVPRPTPLPASQHSAAFLRPFRWEKWDLLLRPEESKNTTSRHLVIGGISLTRQMGPDSGEACLDRMEVFGNSANSFTCIIAVWFFQNGACNLSSSAPFLTLLHSLSCKMGIL